MSYKGRGLKLLQGNVDHIFSTKIFSSRMDSPYEHFLTKKCQTSSYHEITSGERIRSSSSQNFQYHRHRGGWDRRVLFRIWVFFLSGNFLLQLSVFTSGEAILANLEVTKSQNFPGPSTPFNHGDISLDIYHVGPHKIFFVATVLLIQLS